MHIRGEALGSVDHLSDLSLLHGRDTMKDGISQWLYVIIIYQKFNWLTVKKVIWKTCACRIKHFDGSKKADKI